MMEHNTDHCSDTFPLCFSDLLLHVMLASQRAEFGLTRCKTPSYLLTLFNSCQR